MPALKEAPRLGRAVAHQRDRVRSVMRKRREARVHRRVARRRALVEHPSLWVETRRFLRLGGIVLSTIAVFCMWVCFWPVSLLAPKLMRPIRRQLIKLWCRTCLAIIGMKLRVYGRTPKPPCFLVANHISYVDIWVMGALTGAVFVAKADMQTWPLMGWFMACSHQIFIKRESLRDATRVIGLLNQVLDEQDALVVFAEGRCSPGAEVLSFRPSLLQVAAERHFPVHYAALTYATPEGEPAPSDSISWWRWEPLADQMKRMLRLSGSTATVYFGQSPVLSTDRKELARKTEEGCRELFQPIGQGVLEELPPPPDIPAHLFPEFRKKPPVEVEQRDNKP